MLVVGALASDPHEQVDVLARRLSAAERAAGAYAETCVQPGGHARHTRRTRLDLFPRHRCLQLLKVRQVSGRRVRLQLGPLPQRRHRRDAEREQLLRTHRAHAVDRSQLSQRDHPCAARHGLRPAQRPRAEHLERLAHRGLAHAVQLAQRPDVVGVKLVRQQPERREHLHVVVIAAALAGDAVRLVHAQQLLEHLEQRLLEGLLLRRGDERKARRGVALRVVL
mmetsp:Transcript_3898/g.8235  ORF Transcript_3898/g.8235 Transcript_3898/m.8235 type:complete len:223 (+) Transcript_3898:1407-2075(+)